MPVFLWQEMQPMPLCEEDCNSFDGALIGWQDRHAIGLEVAVVSIIKMPSMFAKTRGIEKPRTFLAPSLMYILRRIIRKATEKIRKRDTATITISVSSTLPNNAVKPLGKSTSYKPPVLVINEYYFPSFILCMLKYRIIELINDVIHCKASDF